ncbi:hypothetical protein BZG36_04829 [Bifiguratus adelaidae]|uniref:tRNA(His) guanylyltransferase n=1 Tax=Bifiguratus adelaidae TaxID=1938954 RepID=A0A261XW08_9FUNG|nr:hypothetical protein BZG36_04829 [Bifiguratus adelaidae]
MAKSKYEYVKQFELEDTLLPSTWIVVRIDGRGFHGFSDRHHLTKPNDIRALELMNKAAESVMFKTPDIVLAYGQSDEYSFVLRKNSRLFERRSSKISSTIVSLFTSNYVWHWSQFLPDEPLQYPPSFDARCVCYPSDQILRDYLAWRQVDCHINNMYNTVFWAIVHGGRSETEAENELRGTSSAQKQEILFSQYGINYAKEPEMFKKGSVILRQPTTVSVVSEKTGQPVMREKMIPTISFVDMIKDEFWIQRPYLLGST